MSEAECWMLLSGIPPSLVKPDMFRILKKHMDKKRYWIQDLRDSDQPGFKSTYVKLYEKESIDFFLEKFNSAIEYKNTLIHFTTKKVSVNDVNLPKDLKRKQEAKMSLDEIYQWKKIKRMVRDASQYRLPQFGFVPVITKQMKDVIEKHIHYGKIKGFYKLLKIRLRYRLMHLLIEKDLKSHQAITLYREKHPMETDENLVLHVLQELDNSMFRSITTPEGADDSISEPKDECDDKNDASDEPPEELTDLTVDCTAESDSEEVGDGIAECDSEEVVDGTAECDSEEVVDGTAESEEVVDGTTESVSEEVVEGTAKSVSEEVVDGTAESVVPLSDVQNNMGQEDIAQFEGGTEWDNPEVNTAESSEK